MIQCFFCDCNQTFHLSVPNGLSAALFFSKDCHTQWGTPARKPTLILLLSRRRTAGQQQVRQPTVQCAQSYRNISDFCTNTAVVVGIIMQIVGLLAIYFHRGKCTHSNVFKSTKWKSKTNEMEKTIFCNMWCTCIPANGTLLLGTSHALLCQCFKLPPQWVEFHQALPWGVSTSQNILKRAMVGKFSHYVKLDIVGHSGRKLRLNCFSSSHRKGKKSINFVVFLTKFCSLDYCLKQWRTLLN